MRSVFVISFVVEETLNPKFATIMYVKQHSAIRIVLEWFVCGWSKDFLVRQQRNALENESLLGFGFSLWDGIL